MLNLKTLSAVAVLALAAPLAVTPSFAQQKGGSIGGAGVGVSAGGGGAAVGGSIGGGGAGFSGAGRIGGAQYAGGGGGWHGGGWHGGGWHGGHHWRGGGGFWPGFAAGAVVGGAFGSPYYGYGYGYDDPDYYGAYGYYDEPGVTVVERGGGDGVAYCEQRYRSYDPASGTFLGYDGRRHPCP